MPGSCEPWPGKIHATPSAMGGLTPRWLRATTRRPSAPSPRPHRPACSSRTSGRRCEAGVRCGTAGTGQPGGLQGQVAAALALSRLRILSFWEWWQRLAAPLLKCAGSLTDVRAPNERRRDRVSSRADERASPSARRRAPATGVLAGVEVGAALGTEPAAVLGAYRRHRHREQPVLQRRERQVEHVPVVDAVRVFHAFRRRHGCSGVRVDGRQVLLLERRS